MTSLLMPKATAVWLIDNTTLTFEQIAQFCSLHVLEVQAIADGDVGQGILGFDPILNGQLTQEEIDKCCNDTSLFLSKSFSTTCDETVCTFLFYTYEDCLNFENCNLRLLKGILEGLFLE